MNWLAAIAGVLARIGEAIGKVWPAIATYLLGRSQVHAEHLEQERDAIQEDLSHVREAQKLRRQGRAAGAGDPALARRMRRWQKRRNGSQGH